MMSYLNRYFLALRKGVKKLLIPIQNGGIVLNQCTLNIRKKGSDYKNRSLGISTYMLFRIAIKNTD